MGMNVNLAPATGPVIDPTGQYRYTLWRECGPADARVAFVMLNPSTADATRDDPTIRRVIGFARSWGYGSVEVVNLFAYRAPYPRILRTVPDPIGPQNDRYLVQAVRRAQLVVAAWGTGHLPGRDRAVIGLLGESLYCLGTTQGGCPRHPLYVRGGIVPAPYISPLADME